MDLNKISESDIKKLEEYIAKNERVTYLVSALGICDFDIELLADSPNDLFKFVEDIQDKFPGIIRSYRTLIFDKTIKSKFLPDDI